MASLPLVRPALRSRWPQFIITAVALAGFIFVILAGLAGTPVGSHNLAIIFVWIVWWAGLILLAVPLFGRAWCGICPIPAPGEWLQRGALLGPPARGLGAAAWLPGRRRWPKALRNIWLQNVGFSLVALCSVVVLTQPRVTALVLAGFLLAAIGTSLVFERRAFCRYLCPVGGFIGLYAQLAPIEVRVKDAAICAGHAEKTCYTGSANGYGCPWQVFPGSLSKNTYCGLCTECLRTCPHDNIALNLRVFGADLLQPAGRRLDEACKAFLMLGSAMVYAAVLLGPWAPLKAAANAIGTLPWAMYALGFLLFVFGVLPGLFGLSVLAGRALAQSRANVRQMFVAHAYTLVPLGLGAWIAFSLAFVFTNLSYIWPILSDPLGAGWNLFGTAGAAWTPYLTGVVPALQALVLAGALAWSSSVALRIARERLAPAAAWRQALPIIGYCGLATLGLLVLLIA